MSKIVSVSTVTYINLIPQEQFDVGVLNGEIRVKCDIESGTQYNLYLSSFDGGSAGLLSECVLSAYYRSIHNCFLLYLFDEILVIKFLSRFIFLS